MNDEHALRPHATELNPERPGLAKSTMRVLIADDHVLVAEALKHLVDAQTDMEGLGPAENGFEAVAQARDLEPDVVVLDVMMPHLNGIEAARRITRAPKAPPILMLSGKTDIGLVRRALEAGAAGYVGKNALTHEFVTALRHVHRGQRYLSGELTGAVLHGLLRADHKDDALAQLSGREREVLQLLAEGWKTRDIAGRLKLSAKTIETYRMRLMKKLELRTVPALVLFALREGLIELK